MSTTPPSTLPRVALVAGATRGAGRAIAVALGALGATVWCTGRSTRAGRSEMDRPETIEGTAERVDAAGGRGVAVRCDHSDPAQVAALRDRIAGDGDGRLDVLVDDIWGGDHLVQWGVPFWEQDLDRALRVVRNGLETHLVTAHTLAPLLVAGGRGLLVEMTDGVRDDYRDAHYYDLVKAALIRLARAQSAELAPHGVTAVALTPGFLRSEAMLDHLGVTEERWREGVATDPHFAVSESPAFVAAAVAALACDPGVARWAGRALSSWGLAAEYDLRDADGSRPDWGRWFDEVVLTGRDPLAVDPAGYR